MQLVPTSVQNAFFSNCLSQTFDYCQPNALLPHHDVLSAYPTINDKLVICIQDGLVTVKPHVLNFTEHGIHFTDGSVAENVDCVIFATGYQFSVPFVDKSVFHDVVFYKHVFPIDEINVSDPTLAFIGLVQPWGAMNSVAEIQSRWVVRIFSGSSHLPAREHMLRDIERMNQACQKRFVTSDRHTLNVDIIQYVDDIANQFGAQPSMLWLFLLDPLLALMCIFGPCLPYQHRLYGPGRWEGARGAIQQSWCRMKQRGWVMCTERLALMVIAGICLVVVLLLTYVW